MPAAHRLFFLPELLLPAICVSLKESLKVSDVGAVITQLRDVLSEATNLMTSIYKLTAKIGARRSQPGWLTQLRPCSLRLRLSLDFRLVSQPSSPRIQLRQLPFQSRSDFLKGDGLTTNCLRFV